MFEGEMSLKRWVEESSPHSLSEIVDANLLGREEEADFIAKKACVSSIMSLALKCSADIPGERINVKDALVALKKIKTKFVKDVQQAKLDLVTWVAAIVSSTKIGPAACNIIITGKKV